MGASSSSENQYSVPIESNPPAGRSSIYRNSYEPLLDICQIESFAQAFEMVNAEHGSRPFLGTRETLSDNTLGDYVWKNYNQVYELVVPLAAHYTSLAPRNEAGEAFLGIYMKNREEWIITDIACQRANICSIPLYETLGADQAKFIINQTSLSVIVCTANYTGQLVGFKKSGEVTTLNHIVVVGPIPESSIIAEAQEAGICIISYSSLFEGSAPEVVVEAPKRDSLITICYTSGTTGNPKGVMITHNSLIVSLVSSSSRVIQFLPDDVYLSYLPLAHMMERMCTNGIMMHGGRIGLFGGDIMKIRDDMALLKPTLFASVPRLFNRMYQAINARFEQISRVKKSLVSHAISRKMHHYEKSGALTHRLWDRLVFNKAKEFVGGNVRLMATGSAPIAEDVLKFLRICFWCPIVEGYGQTENCAAAFFTAPSDTSIGHVGGPIACVEYMLEDIPDMNYLSTDKDEEGNLAPRGEICVRGANVFKGYFKNPEETEATIDSNGWLHSGDIGVRQAHDGALKIIDRKKNILKLAQGEYVAVEKVESVCSTSNFVAQIFVHGDSLQAYLVAVVVPAPQYVKTTWCQDSCTDPETSFEDLCKSPELIKAVITDLEAVSRAGGLNGFEIPRKVHLVATPWTAEDLLTPTMKLKRFDAKQHYIEEINALYAS